MKKFSFLIITIICSVLAYCQSYSYAREIVRQLTDSSTCGRGYVKQGDKKAAAIIEKELYNNSFRKNDNFTISNKQFTYQPFNISINNIDSIFLAFGHKDSVKREGYDYIVYGFSPNCDIELKNEKCLIFNNKDKLLNYNKQKLENKVIIFNQNILSYREISLFLRELDKLLILPKLVIIQGYEKLQYPISTSLFSFPTLCLSGEIMKTNKINYLHLKVFSTYYKKYETQNIWAVIPGTEYKDSCFIIMSHYDHLGMCGSAIFPGVSDNASGVAVTLDLVRYYANNPQKYSMVFLFCSGEEIGLFGSKFASENPLFDLNKVKFLLNLDMCGTGSDGISVVNGKNITDKSKILTDINDSVQAFTNIRIKDNACNSDHCPFIEKNVPAFFIYTEGKEDLEYHTVYDKEEVLPLTKHIDLCNLIKDYFKTLQFNLKNSTSNPTDTIILKNIRY